MKTLPFQNGDRMPALGLGTWKSDPGEVGAAVGEAVRLGYRHFDCASIYGNEAEIGAALADCIAAGVVTRDELWITSKLWNDRHATEDVVPALRQTLADLRLEYLDLYLIHWPVALKRGVLGPRSGADFVSLDELPIAATWKGMEDAREAGLCRHVGVSNFKLERLATLVDGARIAPEANQVEMHPYLQQRELVAFCREHGIALTAYSPLGSRDRPDSLKQADEPDLLGDPVVSAVAEGHGASPAQVLIAWAIGRGTAVIPKSVSPERLAQNLAAADLVLSADEMGAIDDQQREYRFISGSFWAMEGSPYTLADLWG